MEKSGGGRKKVDHANAKAARKGLHGRQGRLLRPALDLENRDVRDAGQLRDLTQRQLLAAAESGDPHRQRAALGHARTLGTPNAGRQPRCCALLTRQPESAGTFPFVKKPPHKPLPAPSKIGQNLKRLMEARGVSPTALEAASGVSRVTIWQICEGRVKAPNMATVQKLAAGMKVSLQALLGTAVSPVDAERVVHDFITSGEAGMMMPPPSDAELAYLRRHGEVFEGPAITARGVAFVLMRLRLSPEWATALAEPL